MSILDQMEIFYYVATWKSFSRAALELGVSKGYISSQITQLEKCLGVKLIHRTTRHLSLTDEGSTYLRSCVNIVNEKKQATSLMKEAKIEPSGHLKITAPPSMCATFLAELLPKFQKQYPKISLTIDSSSKIKNLLQHNVDIALRITTIPDENYIARLLSTFHFVICTTEEYLKKHGIPKTPEDLLTHNCLIYSADPTSNNWPFQIQNKMKIITVQGDLISANSSIIQAAVLAHAGIARLPGYIVTKQIADQKMVVLFAEQMQTEMPIYAIYASHATIPPKLQCFIKFLKDHLENK